MVAIRPAQTNDIPAMVALSERYRRRLEAFEPVFWRKAPASAEAQTRYFLQLLAHPDVLALVHCAVDGLAGFLIAVLKEAPPVYAPGGLTCEIDDFCMADERYWPKAGAALLQAAMRSAKERGAVQVVVVCPHRDQTKQTLLALEGLSAVAEWHTRAL